MNCIDENLTLFIPLGSIFVLSFLTNCYFCYRQKIIPYNKPPLINIISPKQKSHLPNWVVDEYLKDQNLKL